MNEKKKIVQKALFEYPILEYLLVPSITKIDGTGAAIGFQALISCLATLATQQNLSWGGGDRNRQTESNVCNW